jgi:hypothetical protein
MMQPGWYPGPTIASSYRTYSSCVLELFSGGSVYGPGKHVFGAEKQKLNKDSGRIFQEHWTTEFGVIEKDNKSLCCLCSGGTLEN